MGLGHILKIKPTEFSDRLEVGLRGEASWLWLRAWRGGFSICWDVWGQLRGKEGLAVEPRRSPDICFPVTCCICLSCGDGDSHLGADEAWMG